MERPWENGEAFDTAEGDRTPDRPNVPAVPNLLAVSTKAPAI